jgi:hypothetical protein
MDRFPSNIRSMLEGVYSVHFSSNTKLGAFKVEESNSNTFPK